MSPPRAAVPERKRKRFKDRSMTVAVLGTVLFVLWMFEVLGWSGEDSPSRSGVTCRNDACSEFQGELFDDFDPHQQIP